MNFGMFKSVRSQPKLSTVSLTNKTVVNKMFVMFEIKCQQNYNCFASNGKC